jgi:hypothetical protein
VSRKSIYRFYRRCPPEEQLPENNAMATLFDMFRGFYARVGERLEEALELRDVDAIRLEILEIRSYVGKNEAEMEAYINFIDSFGPEESALDLIGKEISRKQKEREKAAKAMGKAKPKRRGRPPGAKNKPKPNTPKAEALEK